MLGVDANMLDVDANMLGVDANMLGVDANMLGVDANMLGVDANMLGVDANMLGVDANMLGVDAHMHVASSVELFWSLNMSAYNTKCLTSCSLYIMFYCWLSSYSYHFLNSPKTTRVITGLYLITAETNVLPLDI